MITILTVLALVFASAYWGSKHFTTVTATVVLMLLVHTLGFGITTIMGFTTNVGTVMYGGVMFGLYLVYILHGHRWAQEIRNKTALVLIGYALIAESVRTLALSGEASEIYNHLYAYDLQVTVGSFLAFFISWSVMIWIVDRMRNTHIGFVFTGLIAMIVAQFVDSIIFFPIAFGGVLPATEVWHIAVGGFALKTLIAISAMPFIWVIVNKGGASMFHDVDPDEQLDKLA